jgi:hypothetical protein
MTDTTPPTPPPPRPAPAITPDELKRALKAFKKKLKVMRLERESRQIAGPLSKGSHSGIVAITPPRQFSNAVWEELGKQGKLKYQGDGLYELAGDPGAE